MKITKDKILNSKFIIFLLFLLFTPPVNFRLFFVVVCLLIIAFFFSSEINFGRTAKLTLAYVIFAIFALLLRFGFLVDINFKDFTEIGRFVLPLLIVLSRKSFKKINIESLYYVLGFYILIDFGVSILEFLRMHDGPVLQFVKEYYWSEVHGNVRGRVKGLSPGPGQHGIILFITFVLFYTQVFFAKRIAFNLIFCLIILFSLTFSLSRIGLGCTLIYIFLIHIWSLFFSSKRGKIRSIPLFLSLLFAGSWFVSIYSDKLYRFNKFLNQGFNDSSYQGRLSNWDGFKILAEQEPQYILFGWGKYFYGATASSVDNEYLLILFFHGIIALVLILGSILYFLVKTIFLRKQHKRPIRMSLFFILGLGLIFAWPSTIFTYPLSMTLIFILLNLSYWEEKRLKKDFT